MFIGFPHLPVMGFLMTYGHDCAYSFLISNIHTFLEKFLFYDENYTCYKFRISYYGKIHVLLIVSIKHVMYDKVHKKYLTIYILQLYANDNM